MTWTKRIALTLGLTAAFYVGGALAPTAKADAHRPDPGIAAGVFSSKTSDMCPGGSNGERCDKYGLAWCWNVKGWDHTVNCRRYSTDYRTIFKFPYRCRADGHVNHNYTITWKKYYGCVEA